MSIDENTLACLRTFCNEMELLLRAKAKESSTAGRDCLTPKDEKVVSGGSIAGANCRLNARSTYLLELLRCETQANPCDCADEAYDAYCEAVKSCPT